MSKVFIVKATIMYEIEVTASDEEEAYEHANESPLSEWTKCDFEILDVQLASNNSQEYYGPDTNEEKWGL